MTRAEIHGLFVSEFHQGNAPVPVETPDIQRAQRELATVLPQSYTTFMQTHGSVRTPSLLSLIVDGEHEQWDVMAIFEMEEVIEGTKGYWSAGMSEQLVGFATDSMGNMFCFQRIASGSPSPDDAEIWLFDHDFCKGHKISDTFDEWILSYVKLKGEDQAT